MVSKRDLLNHSSNITLLKFSSIYVAEESDGINNDE